MVINSQAQNIIDASPLPTFIVDGDVVIAAVNQAALGLMRDQVRIPFSRRCGEALDCIHAIEACRCGASEHCSECGVRQAVGDACRGEKTTRQKTLVEVALHGKIVPLTFLVSATPLLSEKGCNHAILVLEDVSALMEAFEIITVCSHCMQVKLDDKKWLNFYDYFFKQFGVRFSHGICNECYEKLYRDII